MVEETPMIRMMTTIRVAETEETAYGPEDAAATRSPRADAPIGVTAMVTTTEAAAEEEETAIGMTRTSRPPRIPIMIMIQESTVNIRMKKMITTTEDTAGAGERPRARTAGGLKSYDR